MHKATCSTCSKPCEVPFRPDGSKPVLCSECFGKNRSDDRNGVERRGFSNDRPQRAPERKFDAPAAPRGPSPDIKALERQVATLEAKLNEVLYILKGSSPAKKVAKTEKVVIPAGEVVTVVSDIKKAPKVAAPKKEAAPKPAAKKVAAKKVAPKKAAKKVTKKK
jgi:CxxC-x17-CxxC domain-containing protein